MLPQGLLIDLDGVLYRGERAILGAADVVQWLERSAIPHLFLTNTTSRPRAALVEKLAKLGITAREEAILTPPVAAGDDGVAVRSVLQECGLDRDAFVSKGREGLVAAFGNRTGPVSYARQAAFT